MKNFFNIILMGPPGSGKGTQANLISHYFEAESISTGDLLRREINKSSELGNNVREIIEAGKLVSDDIVFEMVKEKILSINFSKNIVLDGFPRSLAQAEKLDIFLSKMGKKIDKVLDFVIDDDLLIKRIFGRYSCKDCGSIYNKYLKPPLIEGKCDRCGGVDFGNRSDDNENTIKERLDIFYKSRGPLIEYYKKKHLLVSVDALKTSNLIFEDIKLKINH